MKPRARSVYLSIFMSLASLGLPSPPGARSAKVVPVLRPIAPQNYVWRVTLTRNRSHFRGSRAWHDYGFFIGYPRDRIDISQPAAGRRPVFRLDANVGMARQNGRGLLTNSGTMAQQAGIP